MSRLLRIAFCLFLLMALPLASHASGTDVASVAAKVQTAYADLQSFRADFTQELLQRDSGTVQKRSGTISFKRPLLVRWAIGGAGGKFSFPFRFLLTCREGLLITPSPVDNFHFLFSVRAG